MDAKKPEDISENAELVGYTVEYGEFLEAQIKQWGHVEEAISHVLLYDWTCVEEIDGGADMVQAIADLEDAMQKMRNERIANEPRDV